MLRRPKHSKNEVVAPEEEEEMCSTLNYFLIRKRRPGKAVLFGAGPMIWLTYKTTYHPTTL